MKKELSLEELVMELKNNYIASYDALHVENDHKKSNRLVKKYIELEKQLVSTPEGIKAFSILLEDENDIVRYYSASALISLYPKRCVKILKEKKKKNIFVSYLVKYVISNYNAGNNYIEKFLSSRS